jgi:hypothetical protein
MFHRNVCNYLQVYTSLQPKRTTSPYSTAREHNIFGRSRFDPRLGQRIFSLASVSRPALGPTQPPVQWVPGILSSGVKSGRGVTLTTHPHLVPRSWMSRSYTSSPQAPPWRVAGQLLLRNKLLGELITWNQFYETLFLCIWPALRSGSKFHNHTE